MNFYRIIFYVISFVLLTSCWDNDPKDLFDKGKDELLNNQKEYSYLIDVLENISKATDNSDAYLFIQIKQNNIIYSDSNGAYQNPPIIYPDNFIVIANKLGVDEVWLRSKYYRLGIADNNSTRYSTHLFYQRVDTLLIGEDIGIVHHKRINEKWLVGLKKMPMVIEWLGI